MAKRDTRNEWHERALAELPRPPFEVVTNANADAGIAALPPALLAMYAETIAEFARTGTAGDVDRKPAVKPMKAGSNLDGLWRIAFGYGERERKELTRKTGHEIPAYRIVFEPNRKGRKVLVIYVGPWAEAYRWPTYLPSRTA